jgi:uncharacterized protein YpmS
MVKKYEFIILLIVSIALAILILANVIMDRSNRSLQAELVERQNYIQQSIQLESLYVEMIKAIAELSEQTGDMALRQVLTNQGMTVQAAMRQQVADIAEQTEGTQSLDKK